MGGVTLGLGPFKTIRGLVVLLVLAGSAVLLAAFGTPEDAECEEPYSSPHGPWLICHEYVNDSGQTAGFLHFDGYPLTGGNFKPFDQPAACGEPEIWFGFEYRELVWPEPCIAPGESITLRLYSDITGGVCCFLPSPPVIEAVNETGRAASGLVFDHSGWRGYHVVLNAPGCRAPSVERLDLQLELRWGSDCVDPGETVAVHFWGTSSGVTEVAYVWLFPTLFGDASCDETVDAIDAALVLQYAAALLHVLACTEEADVNGDGSIDAEDALLILQFSAGLLPSLPP